MYWGTCVQVVLPESFRLTDLAEDGSFVLTLPLESLTPESRRIRQLVFKFGF